jgi:translation initiation factor IF-3
VPRRVRKNGDLRGIPEVRVIGSSGQMLGVMTLAEALRLAMKESLDLVEVNLAGKPPVCKLLDFSKHAYEAMKKAALGRRKDEPDDDPE